MSYGTVALARVVAALCLACGVFMTAPAYARIGTFDADAVASVYTEALGFMAPRLLVPASIPELTDWGLRGLAAIDPRIAVARDAAGLHVLMAGRMLAETPAAPDDDAAGWAHAAASLSRVAFINSVPLRRAGQGAIVGAFFDDIFTRFDQYSRYEPPDDAGLSRDARRGIVGIGATFGDQAGAVLVRAVLEDSPASRAGLRPGDRILSVDDDDVEARVVDAETVAGWIGGPEDSDVVVTWRTRQGHIQTAPITRAAIPPESVFADRAGGAAILRVTTFNARTEARFAQELSRILAAPRRPAGLILDLRGNRGGLVRQAANLAGALLPPGLVARTVGRDPEATRRWETDTGDRTGGLPVVVVVDGRTASAAEIVAAALADRGRAVVVGSATYGKGLVQTILDLPDGGELYVSWSRVLAPSGWPLQDLGVLPQVCTGLGLTMLKAELSALDQGFNILAGALRRRSEARVPLSADAALTLRAPCPAADRTDMDLFAARRLIEHPADYTAALIAP